jgi:HPt (histidine-containing phosphotransfer) domain-containing protein
VSGAPRSSTRAPKEPEAITRLMATLWESNLPVLRERLDLLDRAAAAASAGSLSPTLRKDTISIAHKLAGSLGMFGYPEGTECARRIEQHLQASVMVDASRLSKDVADMRAAVKL